MKKMYKKITAREGEIDNYQYAVLQPYGNHYCAYVGLDKDHPMFSIHWSILYEIGLYHPNVNGGLTFSGVPSGLAGRGLTWYGWDYNHAHNQVPHEYSQAHNLMYPNGTSDYGESPSFHQAEETEWIADKKREAHTPSESIVMIDIRNCIDWIKECTEKLERNEVSHQDCPRCNSLTVYQLPPEPFKEIIRKNE
jgi:hypothetical protein